MQFLMDHVKTNKRFFIKATIIVIIALGWFYSAWNGGMMGLWACFCSGVAGYCGGVFTSDAKLPLP